VKTLKILFLTIVAFCFAGITYSQQVDFEKRIVTITNPEPPPLIGVPSQFGYSLAAISNDQGQIIIVAGAPADNVEGIRTGAVHLIDGRTGDLIRTIPNIAPAPGDGFGLSVALDKDGNIIVGAPYDDDPDGSGPFSEVVNAGAVFVFDPMGELLHVIQNPFPQTGDLFGETVAVDQYGNILVSAMRDDDPDGPGPIPFLRDAGAVFVFNSTAELLLTIPSVTAVPWDWFGMTATAYGDNIFIADPFYRISGEYAGAVRIFNKTTGDLLDTWANPFPPPSGDGSWDQFGARLTVNESRGEIIHGAPTDDDPDGIGPIPNVVNAGSVFIHDASTGEILHTIWNPFPDVGDFFGISVASAGSKYVVGAHLDDDPDASGPIPPVVNSGSVFVFNAETAELLQTIGNPFPDIGDQFGRAVTIVNGNIIVGAPLDDDPDGLGPISSTADAGSVFIFDAETGERRFTIESPGGLIPATQDNFGYAVAMSSTRIIAGAPNDALDLDGPGGTEPVVGAGSVYILDKNGSLQTTIWNPAPSVNDAFGESVAIDKDKIIVGAPSDDDPDGTGPIPEIINAGAVFIFDMNGTLLNILTDPYPDANNNFGISVVLDNYGNIIVGAKGEDDPDGPGPLPEIPNAGAVYVFDNYGTFLHTIANPFPASPDNFGACLAVDKSGNIVIGAPNDGDPDGPGPIPFVVEAGAAFVFNVMTGEILHTLYDPERDPVDQFGISTAVDPEGKIIVGATNKPGGGGGGVVFIFEIATGGLLGNIVNPAPETGDAFGRYVAATGGKYFIGAATDNDPDGPGSIPKIINAGAVFIYDSETLELLSIVQNPAPGIGDFFGISVASIGGEYVIGASLDDDPDGPGPIPEALDAGSVFLFKGIGEINPKSIAKSATLNVKPVTVIEYGLSQNYPNPFSLTTQIEYQLARESKVTLVVYNEMGQMIRTLVSSYQGSGQYYVTWDGKDDLGFEVSNGIYLYRFVSNGLVQNKRMLILR